MATSVADLSVDYENESVPFVIRENRLSAWPCTRWTLQEWADKCGKIKFKFRIHRNRSAKDEKASNDSADSLSSRVEWENEATDHVDATIAELLQHCNGHPSENGSNPLARYSPLSQWTFYSSYNYMHKLFADNAEIFNSIRWRDTEIGEPKLANDAGNSTFWIGTEGASTPCHMDTYGYNFVAQLHGKKLWILFPPTDTGNLYPTRIPFEESSIFSGANLQYADLRRFARLRNTKPRIVELSAGEILFVPRHWWHFVRNVSNVAISVNTWIRGLRDSDVDDSISECLVQFLTRPLLDAYGDQSWLNANADLLTAPEAARILQTLLGHHRHCRERENPANERGRDQAERLQREGKRRKIRNVHYLAENTFDDIMRLSDFQVVTNYDNDAQRRSPSPISSLDAARRVLNCILDPEVIDLIKRKLLEENQQQTD